MTHKVRLLAVLVLALGLFVMCGPSLRRTQQSDNAFILCFDLDARQSATTEEKTACWQTWIDKYVYNQFDDKIRHAEDRLNALQKGGDRPPSGPIDAGLPDGG
jgi:hypothetical protein